MRLITPLLSLLYSFSAQSQTVVHQPDYETSSAPYVQVAKVELHSNVTRLFFTVNYDGDWIKIPSTTYIQAGNDTTRLYIKSGDGIEIDKQHKMGDKNRVTYTLDFPAINAATSTINYGEDGGSWFIEKLELSNKTAPDVMPKNLRGGWYNSKTGLAEIAFYKNTAVFDNKIWRYKLIDLPSKTILLTDNKTVKRLYFNQSPDKIQIGTSSQNAIFYVKNILAANINNIAAYRPDNVLKIDTAIYEGYIANYNSTEKLKTGKVAVNNVFTDNQDSYVIQINEQGYFKVRIPLFYPEDIFVNLGNHFTVFVEPGKTLFHIIDAQYGDVFMGTSGQINRELKFLSAIKFPGYEELTRKIGSVSSTQYKDFLLSNKNKLLDSLNTINKEFTISERAVQLKTVAIENNCTQTLLSYNMDFENHVRDKYNLMSYKDSLPEKAEKPEDYYDFLSNTIIGNPVYLMSASSFFLFNRLFFLKEARSANLSYSLTSTVFIDSLIRQNIASKKVAELKEIQKQKNSILVPYKATIAPFELQLSNLIKENMDLWRKYYKKFPIENGYSTSRLLLFLKDSNVAVSDTMIAAYQKYESTAAYQKFQELTSRESKLSRNLTEQYGGLHSFWIEQGWRNARNYFFEHKLQLKNPLLHDIIISQASLKKLISQTSPLRIEELDYLKKQLQLPIVASYWQYCNNAVNNTIAKQRNNTESKINELGNVEVRKVLSSITDKFKGKVIYIDFWATWCSPCIAGIREIAPLKEEMKEKNTVFLYITDASSPEKTWKNMIAGINGEHFRLTENEWNYLAGFFNISGIPHYALVNKKGEIVTRDLEHKSNEELKKIFEKMMAE
ncbi:TlpA disulfide reductase family protein [Niabella yanshanensis]|uniref:TlpA disulfide reductase family protein n=1 Tax=Niabella yanshanensis TaxID=577386 RepID=A0ABZ0W4H4_9BACT|nr:TlpA disulfide reductase family protein [Niabella yanshanensis]WQD38150.1 TlpA disulfide reductase family protein [Niabella yanshanensis]